MKMKQAIVITGASTGIGRASALRMENDGFTVFAGVKKIDDDALIKDSKGRIVPLHIKSSVKLKICPKSFSDINFGLY